MSERLFVYGTLLADGPQAGLLGDHPRRPARVAGRLYRLPAGYPALEIGDQGEVHGELVTGLHERLLRVLDHFEGVGEGLFDRVLVRVVTADGTRPAWTYAMQAPRNRGGVPIPSGRWRAALRR